MYDQRQIAPDGSTNRSYFGNHVFIGAPAPVKGGGERIIDCTCGPHVGDKTFRQYLVATMETPPSKSDNCTQSQILAK
jgi:hypothetical protein